MHADQGEPSSALKRINRGGTGGAGGADGHRRCPSHQKAETDNVDALPATSTTASGQS